MKWWQACVILGLRGFFSVHIIRWRYLAQMMTKFWMSSIAWARRNWLISLSFKFQKKNKKKIFYSRKKAGKMSQNEILGKVKMVRDLPHFSIVLRTNSADGSFKSYAHPILANAWIQNVVMLKRWANSAAL